MSSKLIKPGDRLTHSEIIALTDEIMEQAVKALQSTNPRYVNLVKNSHKLYKCLQSVTNTLEASCSFAAEKGEKDRSNQILDVLYGIYNLKYEILGLEKNDTESAG